MKILFLGACTAKHDVNYLISNERHKVQHAAQAVCWRFIDGVDAASEMPCDVLCTMRVSRYPGFRKLIAFRLPSWDRGQGARGSYIPYLNLAGLRYLSTTTAALARILPWVWQNRREEHRVIITYAMYTPCILAVLIASKMTNSQSIMIIPDLPEFTGPPKLRRFTALLRFFNSKIAHLIASRFNGLILFSENMAERLDVSRLTWDVIEGCVEIQPKEVPTIVRKNDDRQIILYSGGLSANYGVSNLLAAFQQLNRHNTELWLCGDGDLMPTIKALAENDSRIIYFGSLPNKKVLAMQRQATVLINPRSGTHEFTRYSFPSKNLEYLTSGRPAIFCRMDGMPAEYYDHAFICEADTPEALTKSLREVLAMPESERIAFGNRARDFVFAHKNYKTQGQKLMQLILACKATKTHKTE